ncbi:hypothetical protein BWQ96_03543 [Gracilariopsis chorda]|uniref:Uncharacterized protein n=1 Tax=Gracilariopsis chorda TaxID=448386 RepID=A0A2V3IYF8_9FLOR|nr:hypothetical protein BWQ96_03543 [Gracilariopsis chorda]|eukprot:PXF46717.1 hypothetical protein BWQ96_03543 [Gracilariopsis chorda]
MTTAKKFVNSLLLELCTILTALLPCFADSEDFNRALNAPWFEQDVQKAIERFQQLERVVYGKRRNNAATQTNSPSSVLPGRLKGLLQLEGDTDLHRIVRYGQWFQQYLRDARLAKRVLKRELPNADATDRYYALNYATTPRDELEKHSVQFEERTGTRSMLFWVRDLEVSMKRSKVAVTKVKNAASDWFWDEKAGKATVVSDGVESRVVFTPRKRKPASADEGPDGHGRRKRR